MAGAIEFYFDFSSPYGYFASVQVNGLAAEFGLSRYANDENTFLQSVYIRQFFFVNRSGCDKLQRTSQFAQ